MLKAHTVYVKPYNLEGAQNLNLEERQIQGTEETSPTCTVRAGFADFVVTSAVKQAQQDLLSCMERNCVDEDCLVITGHSQGGASALVLCT